MGWLIIIEISDIMRCLEDLKIKYVNLIVLPEKIHILHHIMMQHI